MKKKKNRFHLKNLFSDRYTAFQKMWIVILLFLICASLVMTVWQIGVLVLRTNTSSVSEKKTAASAVPSAEADQTVLASTEDAGRDYINSTLFLGDSNTVRFMNETDENGNTYTTKDNTIGVVGMGVNAIDSLKCMQFSSGTFTMVDAVGILQPQRIIITFGTNNLTGSDSRTSRDAFIKSYTEQLKKIKAAYPEADLIVNSIPPISQNTIYTNLNAMEILHWNQAIEKMCEENKWHYLNSFEVLADAADGYALPDMMDAADGLHLGDKGLQTLFAYIRTHASSLTDKRTKPLKEIPEIIGCRSDMISTNPLNGSSFNGTEGGIRRNPIQPNTYHTAAPVQTPQVQPNTQPAGNEAETPVQNQRPAEKVPQAPAAAPAQQQQVQAEESPSGQTSADHAAAAAASDDGQ